VWEKIIQTGFDYWTPVVVNTKHLHHIAWWSMLQRPNCSNVCLPVEEVSHWATRIYSSKHAVDELLASECMWSATEVYVDRRGLHDESAVVDITQSAIIIAMVREQEDWRAWIEVPYPREHLSQIALSFLKHLEVKAHLVTIDSPQQ